MLVVLEEVEVEEAHLGQEVDLTEEDTVIIETEMIETDMEAEEDMMTDTMTEMLIEGKEDASSAKKEAILLEIVIFFKVFII